MKLKVHSLSNFNQNTVDLCTTVCMLGKRQSGNGVGFVGDTVSHFPNSLRQNGFGQAGKTTDVLLECDTRVAKNSQWQCMCLELT